MERKPLLLLGVLTFLYGATWVGGWLSHSAAIQAQARHWSANANVHPGGPRFGVNWCVPVVPGVVLVDSYCDVGPMNGCGGEKVVVWYGFGSWEVMTLSGWTT